ncbi:MAG: hypothetical protein IID45_10750, partial [Planctomycetes bacterium]|nr:hypothetical protein [Planctomycetota bacterium]
MNGKQFRNERRKARQDRQAVLQRTRKRIAMQRALSAHDRQGSVIVVVIVLLMGLLFLGMLLFTEASQEETTAEYFAAAAKFNESELDPDPLFDDALRQIMLGANNKEYQSPFYGGRISLLPTMFGKDRSPFNGRGVYIGWNSTDKNFVDNDRDGKPDGKADQVGGNQSPAATGEDRADTANAANPFEKQSEPDVAYSYPDHTSPFLFYRAPVRDPNTGAIRWVQLPSFHRPQLLRGLGIAPSQWLKDARTAALVFRPHQEHWLILSDGSIAKSGGTQQHRFVSGKYPDTAPGPKIGSFPFPTFQEGVWTNNGNTYVYDVDADGDGTKEAVYIDFSFGIHSTPGGGPKFVPMIAVTIKDMGALLNLNAVGNTVKTLNADGSASPPTASAGFLTRSNLGASRAEINPGYALRTPIGGAGPNDFT